MRAKGEGAGESKVEELKGGIFSLCFFFFFFKKRLKKRERKQLFCAS